MSLFTEQHSLNLDHGSESYTAAKTSSPHTVPFFVSLLISESFFSHVNSPAATIIIPFFKKDIPYAYFIIIILELITAMLIKWYYGPYYSILSPSLSTALPDLNVMRQTYTYGQTLPWRRRQNQQQPEESSPLLPLGMSFNLSFSSPFTAPTSKTATLYTIQLKEIKNVPGYLVPLAALILYFVLEPLFKAKESTTANNNSNK
ncbi:MAG: hypothetical protein ACOX3R_16065 [Desulfitobacteriia bacterium]|jgi:hypothetical protein